MSAPAFSLSAGKFRVPAGSSVPAGYSDILIKSAAGSTRRVRVVRIDNRRRARVARVLHALGLPLCAIRRATGFSGAGLARVLAAPEAAGGLWGNLAARISSELRSVQHG